MSNIVILGAGVMGAALSVPASVAASNQVSLVGSPLDDTLIDAVQLNRMHPNLQAQIPTAVQALKLNQLDEHTLQSADVIIIGVSSPGIEWATSVLNDTGATPALLGLVTKGLVANQDPASVPLTYADALPAMLSSGCNNLVGIGGPCIARELALGFPTRVTFASKTPAHAEQMRKLMQTEYYRITTHTSVVAVEACAALKNFLCIGVSAMISAYPLNDGHAKNPLAALYNQAVLELLILSRWIAAAEYASQDPAHSLNDVAFDLAGMGDLHVTVGGGRNSRLGNYLGTGQLLNDVMNTELAGITVEGVDTGRRLAPGFHAACASGNISVQALPLTAAILNTIENNAPFDFDFISLPS